MENELKININDAKYQSEDFKKILSLFDNEELKNNAIAISLLPIYDISITEFENYLIEKYFEKCPDDRKNKIVFALEKFFIKSKISDALKLLGYVQKL